MINTQTSFTVPRSIGSGTSYISKIGVFGIGHMRRFIHTKFDAKLTVFTENYLDLFTGFGTYHIAKIRVLGTTTHTKFDVTYLLIINTSLQRLLL